MLEYESVHKLCEETASMHSPLVDLDGSILCNECTVGDYGFLLPWPCATAMVLMAMVVVETGRGYEGPYA